MTTEKITWREVAKAYESAALEYQIINRTTYHIEWVFIEAKDRAQMLYDSAAELHHQALIQEENNPPAPAAPDEAAELAFVAEQMKRTALEAGMWHKLAASLAKVVREMPKAAPAGGPAAPAATGWPVAEFQDGGAKVKVFGPVKKGDLQS